MLKKKERKSMLDGKYIERLKKNIKLTKTISNRINEASLVSGRGHELIK